MIVFVMVLCFFSKKKPQCWFSPCRGGWRMLKRDGVRRKRSGALSPLHYYEGYSIREIGKLLDLPAATVGTRLARGRDRLREMLKEEIE